MKNNYSRSSSSPGRRTRFDTFSAPLQFVRPSMNLALARARFGAPSADTLWTPNLVDRLRAPLTRFRD